LQVDSIKFLLLFTVRNNQFVISNFLFTVRNNQFASFDRFWLLFQRAWARMTNPHVNAWNKQALTAFLHFTTLHNTLFNNFLIIFILFPYFIIIQLYSVIWFSYSLFVSTLHKTLKWVLSVFSSSWHIIVLFVETPRKFITAKLSIRKPGSSSMLIICDLFFIHTPFLYTIFFCI
jgi:hypothetical protein